MTYLVTTEQFKGPIDLLLYLVRRHEISISTIGLAQLVNEFLDYLDILKEISIDAVGDFVDTASLLIEIKTREILPRNELELSESEDMQIDPREDLVKRLLLYKQFKDASLMLEERGLEWRKRFVRRSNDTPSRQIEISDQPLEELHLWDLVSAFGRVLKENLPAPRENVIIDETPIHVYMQRIHARILDQQRVSFTELFENHIHKSALIGIFLAVLELTRHHNVVAEQSELHSEIVLVPGDGFSEVLDISNLDDYNPHQKKFGRGDPGSLVQ